MKNARNWLVPCLLVLLGAVADRALGDTFLLHGGGRVYGDLEDTYVGPDEGTWMRVSTTFGDVRFPKRALKRRLESKRTEGPLRVTSIMVSTMSGLVEKASDGKTWNRLSPRSREGRTGAPPINTPNGIVAPGDTVRTGEDGEIDLDVGWGVLHIAANSEVLFRKDTAASRLGTMRVKRGSLGGRLDSVPKEGDFRVETPQASMGVRGTTFCVRVGDAARFVVEEGEVEVGGAGGRADEAFQVAADGTGETRPVDDADRAVFERLRRTYSIPRIERVLIVGGSFDFPSGTPAGLYYGRDKSLWEQVRVTVPSFQMSRYEVTNAQYDQFLRFMDDHEEHYFCHPQEQDHVDHHRMELEYGTPAEYFEEAFGGDDQPRVMVEWFDAWAFCAWIGARLPSDTEWEWAAVSGDPRGPDEEDWDDRILEYARCKDNCTAPGHEGVEVPGLFPPFENVWARWIELGVRTAPVGSLKPDRNGIHDLYGNADEWVSDGGTQGNIGIPRDGRPRPEYEFIGLAGNRYARGGGFHNPWSWCDPMGRVQGRGPTIATGIRPVFDVVDR